MWLRKCMVSVSIRFSCIWLAQNKTKTHKHSLPVILQWPIVQISPVPSIFNDTNLYLCHSLLFWSEFVLSFRQDALLVFLWKENISSVQSGWLFCSRSGSEVEYQCWRHCTVFHCRSKCWLIVTTVWQQWYRDDIGGCRSFIYRPTLLLPAPLESSSARPCCRGSSCHQSRSH